MTLSASLIVRNESTEIAACLDSLAGVDEIALVDTGSEDDTRDLVAAWADAHPETRVILAELPPFTVRADCRVELTGE